MQLDFCRQLWHRKIETVYEDTRPKEANREWKYMIMNNEICKDKLEQPWKEREANQIDWSEMFPPSSMWILLLRVVIGWVMMVFAHFIVHVFSISFCLFPPLSALCLYKLSLSFYVTIAWRSLQSKTGSVFHISFFLTLYNE